MELTRVAIEIRNLESMVKEINIRIGHGLKVLVYFMTNPSQYKACGLVNPRDIVWSKDVSHRFFYLSYNLGCSHDVRNSVSVIKGKEANVVFVNSDYATIVKIPKDYFHAICIVGDSDSDNDISRLIRMIPRECDDILFVDDGTSAVKKNLWRGMISKQLESIGISFQPVEAMVTPSIPLATVGSVLGSTIKPLYSSVAQSITKSEIIRGAPEIIPISTGVNVYEEKTGTGVKHVIEPTAEVLDNAIKNGGIVNLLWTSRVDPRGREEDKKSEKKINVSETDIKRCKIEEHESFDSIGSSIISEIFSDRDIVITVDNKETATKITELIESVVGGDKKYLVIGDDVKEVIHENTNLYIFISPVLTIPKGFNDERVLFVFLIGSGIETCMRVLEVMIEKPERRLHILSTKEVRNSLIEKGFYI